MAKLSHIDDFEEKPGDAKPLQDEPVGADLGRPAQETPAPKPSAAQAEADFHGISSAEKMPIGQRTLIVAAVVVVLAAVAYIVHYLLS